MTAPEKYTFYAHESGQIVGIYEGPKHLWRYAQRANPNATITLNKEQSHDPN